MRPELYNTWSHRDRIGRAVVAIESSVPIWSASGTVRRQTLVRGQQQTAGGESCLHLYCRHLRGIVERSSRPAHPRTALGERDSTKEPPVRASQARSISARNAPFRDRFWW